MRAFRRSLPMSLLRAREAVMKNFLPHLRQHDLSAQQWRVLRALYDTRDESPELEMNVLADRCFLLMPSLSRIVQLLAKRDLIVRRPSERDQRRMMIALTDVGAALVEAMAPQSEARYERIQSVFGYGKLELLYELLDELTEKMNAIEKTDSETKATSGRRS